ncbi:hypothetical protein F4810DRAFT_695603 [Camillea tinctor]|nr:hypothetical protein F4810DRAFT_695603 [Camillea tinctor]
MPDWDKDEFLSEWDRKYVSTNVKAGAQPYNKDFFLALNTGLANSHPELKNLSYSIIVTACCAVSRADVVGRFFDDITIDESPESSQSVFLQLREAITIVFPYLGMPTCIPACYGMVGAIQRKGPEFASTQVLRKDTVDEEDARKGRELRSRIYQGVGNSEIFSLMDKYFTDLFTCSTVVTWGYLISKANEHVFEVQESHLIVMTAITGLGATRQTKSHVKATLGIGNSVECVKSVINAIAAIAKWADRPIDAVDVDELEKAIQR